MALGVIAGVVFGLELLSLASIPNVLMKRRGQPTSAAAWSLALILLPGIALIAWWTIGRTRLERRLRRHISARGRVQSGPFNQDNTAFNRYVPERAAGTHFFSSCHNHVRLLFDGRSAFSELGRALSEAQHVIHLFFYVFELDATGQDICRCLIDRRDAGVAVRLLLDGFGCQSTSKQLRELLEPHGVEVAVFLPRKLNPFHAPRLNFANHRKIVVVDNRIGFTGGMNIGDEYARDWRDLMVRLEGPAVGALNHVFLEDWFFATEELLRTPAALDPQLLVGATSPVAVVASGPDTESWIHDAYFASITGAKARLWVATPYFIPTAALKQALRTAAGSGVDVRVVVPRESDVALVCWAGRSYFRSLLDDGVRVFEYQPGMLHAKAFVVDEHCFVGSANVDHRSMELSFEVCCLIASADCTAELAAWMEGLMDESEEVTKRSLERKPKREKVFEAAAHLLGPLL